LSVELVSGDEMVNPAGYWFVCNGVGPKGSTDQAFYLATELVNRLEREGPAWKFHDIKLIPESLIDPLLIYQGLGREGYELAYCYVARPDYHHDRNGARCANPLNMVFMVYVDPYPYGFVIYDWAWREQDSEHHGKPRDWQAFTGGVIWPKKS
jgi:hypothetical protein